MAAQARSLADTRRPRIRSLAALSLLISCGSPELQVRPAPSQPVIGYQARACGFDLNDNGRIGEADDCRVCDGQTRDPDGDGVEEDLFYVDCGAGIDSADCGSPDRPCATIEHAWSHRADGGSDGAEDIVCFRGRCSPDVLTPASSGAPGVRRQPPTGSQDRELELPTNPTLLVGWDVDGDGEYPPYDSDDEAVLDGRGLSRAFYLGAGNSRLEMAHFSVADYGRFSDVERSGFVHFGERGGLRADHLYFHDLELSGINQDQPAQGHRIVFNFFTGGTNFHHLAFVNLKLTDVGGFMVRGSGPYRPGTDGEGGNDGPFRWQNLSVTAHGCDHSSETCRQGGGSAFIGWKLWGWIDGIEILDSHFDANVGAWEPKPMGNGGALWINATQCSRGWTIRNNRVLDFKVGVEVQGGNGAYCGYDTRNDPPKWMPRRTGDVVIDRNVLFNTYGPWRRGDYGILLKGGDDVNRTVDDVRVTNNVVASTDGFDACIYVGVGHASKPLAGEHPGTIEIYSNTCWGTRAEGRSTGLEVAKLPVVNTPAERLRIRNNLFTGLKSGDYAMRFRYRPSELVLSHNVASPASRFALGPKRVADWSGLAALLATDDRPFELFSRSCEPAFVDPQAGDFHLASTECGGEGGGNLSFWLHEDFEGDPRPEGGAWAVGADEP